MSMAAGTRKDCTLSKQTQNKSLLWYKMYLHDIQLQNLQTTVEAIQHACDKARNSVSLQVQTVLSLLEGNVAPEHAL